MVDNVPRCAPSPWIPESDPVRLAVLGKATEELGELSSIIGRIIIQGIDESEPITGKPNRVALEHEIADVLSMISHIEQTFDLDVSCIENRKYKKFHYLRSWLTMLSAKK